MEPEVKHLSQTSNKVGINADQSLPLPGTEAYEALPQFPKYNVLPFRRTIRRHELRQILPLAETTIYEWSVVANFRVASTSRRDASCGIWTM
jgi:prophage regulatory protein